MKSSKKHYNYDHSKINFRDKRSAVNSINEWASKSTDGKLAEITKDVQNPDGAMIVNAMFFKRKSKLRLIGRTFSFELLVRSQMVSAVCTGVRVSSLISLVAHWDEKFHEKMVDKRGFLVTRSHTIGVSMMHRTGEVLLHPCF